MVSLGRGFTAFDRRARLQQETGRIDGTYVLTQSQAWPPGSPGQDQRYRPGFPVQARSDGGVGLRGTVYVVAGTTNVRWPGSPGWAGEELTHRQAGYWCQAFAGHLPTRDGDGRAVLCTPVYQVVYRVLRT